MQRQRAVAERSTNFWGDHEFCWACRVLDGVTPGCIVTQDETVAIVVNPFPLNPGHVLVIPRQHVENIYDLPETIAGPILSMAARAARAAKCVLGADGVTLRQNNGAASDQHLFHFHLHVVPRFSGDGERFNAQPQHISIGEQERMCDRLRPELA
jgi:histidine triad (HIT) family protein